jgi:hypothetical protein
MHNSSYVNQFYCPGATGKKNAKACERQTHRHPNYIGQAHAFFLGDVPKRQTNYLASNI